MILSFCHKTFVHTFLSHFRIKLLKLDRACSNLIFEYVWNTTIKCFDHSPIFCKTKKKWIFYEITGACLYFCTLKNPLKIQHHGSFTVAVRKCVTRTVLPNRLTWCRPQATLYWFMLATKRVITDLLSSMWNDVIRWSLFVIRFWT